MYPVTVLFLIKSTITSSAYHKTSTNSLPFSKKCHVIKSSLKIWLPFMRCCDCTTCWWNSCALVFFCCTDVSVSGVSVLSFMLPHWFMVTSTSSDIIAIIINVDILPTLIKAHQYFHSCVGCCKQYNRYSAV